MFCLVNEGQTLVKSNNVKKTIYDTTHILDEFGPKAKYQPLDEMLLRHMDKKPKTTGEFKLSIRLRSVLCLTLAVCVMTGSQL
jgi:hypothetical protein